MPSPNKAFGRLALLAAAMLSACGTPDRPRLAGRGRPVADAAVKLGAPYKAGGRIWVPADDRAYDVVGEASWYGAQHRGRPTANGERFDPAGISAAHTTLPLPSYAEVTALATGRTILVRINDRGPFAAGRIIDLSQGAARLLGVERDGVARVRVRRVFPGEADRAALRAGRPAAARPTASRQELAMLASRFGRGALQPVPPGLNTALTLSLPKPGGSTLRQAQGERIPAVQALIPPNVPPRADRPATGAAVARPAARIVQPRPASAMRAAMFLDLGGFDDPDRADAFASAAGTVGPAAVIGVGAEWRVRIGPLADEAATLSALARAGAAGYHDAHIVSESDRSQDHR